MKRKDIIVVLLFLLVSVFKAEAESTMELLINKEWYEINLKKMETRDDYYVKFTGTQRLIVGTDEKGNTKMRVQKYYLSNKYAEEFDSTQVGKNRNGKYLVLSGKKEKNYTAAICMKLHQLDDYTLRMGGENKWDVQHCFVWRAEKREEEEEAEKGTVISTKDLLVDKMWYEVDIKTGKRKRTETLYDKDGMLLHCTMAENPKRDLPDWQMREYYFSDNIEREFKHSKIGDRDNGIYLVVKEKGADGEWYAANYDISTLSANRLVLDCVYPKGVPTRTFMTRSAIETSGSSVKKPQRWQLAENDWYRLDTANLQRRNFVERFDSVSLVREYNVIENGIRTRKETKYAYYMSNTADTVFNYDKVGKSLEGDYVVVNEHTRDGERVAVSYKVDYLDSKNMLLSIERDSTVSIIAYERDLSAEEKDNATEDSIMMSKKRTTLDYLSGRQWRFAKRPNVRMSKWERWYFTDSVWATVDFVYDEFKKVWNASIKTQSYYLAEMEHKNFSMNQLRKKNEDGRFITFYRNIKRKIKLPNPVVELGGNPPRRYFPRPHYMVIHDRMTYSYEMLFLTDWVMVFSPTDSRIVYRYTMVSN